MDNYETRTAVRRAVQGLVDKSESVDGLLNVVVWRAVQGVVTGAAGDTAERDSEHPVLEDFLRFRCGAV